jgi:hypothetical protein
VTLVSHIIIAHVKHRPQASSTRCSHTNRLNTLTCTCRCRWRMCAVWWTERYCFSCRGGLKAVIAALYPVYCDYLSWPLTPRCLSKHWCVEFTHAFRHAYTHYPLSPLLRYTFPHYAQSGHSAMTTMRTHLRTYTCTHKMPTRETPILVTPYTPQARGDAM